MGRTREAKAIILELLQRIKFAESKKREITEYLLRLRKRYVEKNISYSQYTEAVYKKRGGRNLQEWIEYYDDYITRCEKEIKQQKKVIVKKQFSVLFFSLFLIFLFFIIGIYIQPKFTGFLVQEPVQIQVQEFSQTLNIKFNESNFYEWLPENIGQLISAKLSGSIEGKGAVRIYLEDILIFDNSKSSAQPQAGIIEENRGIAGAITGSVVNESYSEEQEEGALPKEDSSPSQEEPLPSSEISNITTSEENTTEEIISNETKEGVKEETPEIKFFTGICEETCDLSSLNLNKSSYTLRIEISDAKLILDEIIYEIIMPVEIPEEIPEEISEEIPIEEPVEEVPEEIPEINVTVSELPENITAELNVTANATITTTQFQAVLGQPVKWKKQIDPENPGNLTLKLPKEAEKIKINKIKENQEAEARASITGGVIGTSERDSIILRVFNFFKNFIKNLQGAITGKTIETEVSEEKEIVVEIDDETADYEITYETPAPYAIEEEIAHGKRITIVGPETLHYENVLVFTNLSEGLNIKNPSRVKIHWLENNTYLSPTKVEDKDNNGIYDYVEWIAPSLSEQTFEIIIITKAEHLDSNKEFISDIYNEVKALDDVWSETIPSKHYVRVTFNQQLTNKNDITLYPRIVSGSPKIEVYEIDENNLIATFESLTSNEYNKVLLTNLQGSQDVFDLHIVGGSVEIEHIIDPGWWNSSFNKCKNITITSAVSSTLTNFPAYINLSKDDDMLSNYADLRFVNTSCNNGGSQLAHEIENYTTTAADIWVRIPSLPSAGTTISVYYKNTTGVSSGENPTGVWDNNYVIVQHLEETSGTITDSANKNNCTNNGLILDAIGKIDGGDQPDTNTDNLNCGSDSSLQPANAITFEAWGKGNDATEDQYSSLGGLSSSGSWINGYGIFFDSASTIKFFVTAYNTNFATASIIPQNWNYVVGTYNKDAGSNQVNIYVNATAGTPDTFSTAITYGGGAFTIAQMGGWTTDWFNGTIDEVRVSNVSRSADWINQSYQIVANQGSYVSFGSEETGNAVPSTPTNIQCNGADNCNISVDTSVDLNASGSTDDESDAINYTIEASLQNITEVQNTTGVNLTATITPTTAVTSVRGYYFQLPQNTTNTSYQPFINGQTMNNSVPFATVATNITGNITEDFFRTYLVDVYFNSTGVIVNRTWPYYTSMNVSVYVVQFNSNSVRVQNGTFSMDSAATAKNVYTVMGTAVDISKTALVFYYASNDTTDDYTDNSIMGKIVNSTYINFSTNTSATTGIKVGRWYVFESLDGGFSVQNVTLTFAATTTTAAEVINSVDTAKTFLIASYESGENDDDARDGSLNVSLDNSTGILGRRSASAASPLRANVYAITFAGDEVVQRGTFTYATTIGSAVAVISTVNTSMTMPWNPVLAGRMNSGGTTNAAISAFQMLNITNSTGITGFRANATNAAGGTWEVIQWSIGGGILNDTNITPTNYTDVDSDYKSITNITIKVEVDSYDPSASVNQATNDPDLWLDIYNGTDWIPIGEFNLNETYTGTGLNTTNYNFSLTTTDSEILSGWQTSTNQDFSIKGIYMDHNTTLGDEINYTNVWVTINGIKWTIIGNHTQTTDLTWDTSDIDEQTGIDLRARAIDNGSNTYSSYYTKNAYMNISHVIGGNPVASFGTNPVDNYNSSSSSVTFELKVSDDSGVDELKLYGNWSGSWAANQTNSSPINDTVWSIQVTGIPNGRFRWAAWGNDTAGNSAFTTTNRTFTVDTVAPTITLPVYINATKYKNTQTLTLNVSVSDATSGLLGSACKIEVNGTNTTIAVSNGWCNSTTIPLTNLADGNKTIKVYVNDTVNNLGLNNSYVAWIDTNPPTITLPVYTNLTAKKSSDNLLINASVADSGVGASYCAINVATATASNVSVVVSSGWCNASYSLAGTSEGNQIINVYANDTLGNTALNNSYSVKIDNTAPVVSFGANVSDNNNRSNSSATFELKVSDNIEISYLRLYGNWSGSWAANQTNSSPFNNTFWNVTVTGIPDGKYRWAGWGNDTAGNSAFTTTNRTFTVDTVAPTITLPVYTNATKYKNTQNMIFNLSVTDIGIGASYCSINVNGNSNQTVTVSSGWCNGTYALTGIADGNKTINAYANDTLGNTALNNSYVIWIDTTPPTWNNQGQSADLIGQGNEITLYTNWSDNTGLGYAWLETNETGVTTNYTGGTHGSPIDINLTGAETWSNFTWSNSSVYSGIKWRIWANDTLGNINVTDYMTFIINATPVVSEPKSYNTSMQIPTDFKLNDTVVILTNITDPNGKDDVKEFYITIKDPLGSVKVANETILKFRDYFNEANGPASKWNNITGTWSISSNRYYYNAVSTYRATSLVKESQIANQTDVIISVKANLTYSAEDSIRIVFRYKNQNNFAALFMTKYYSAFGIEEYIDGTRYFTDTSKLTNLNQWYELKVKVRGDKAEGYLNGVKIIERTLSSTDSGRLGLGADAARIYFENYTVGSPNASQIGEITDGYTYGYNYTVPNNSSLEGTWDIDVYGEDEFGNIGHNSSTFYVSWAKPTVYTPKTYNETGDETSSITLSKNVTIRVNVTDPQGKTDLGTVLINLTNPESTLKITNGVMTNISSITNGYLYAYNYTIPVEVDSEGTWSVNITANDTSNNKDSNSVTFSVPSTYPVIETLNVYNASYQFETPFEYEPIHIKANISDPDGRTDLGAALVTITNPLGTVKVNNETMTDISDITNGNIYEYNYTIPSESNSIGTWSVDVYVNDSLNYKSSDTTHLLVKWWNMSWNYSKPIALGEIFNIDRSNEQLGFNLTIVDSKLASCNEVRVTDQYGVEVSSDIWWNQTSGGYTTCMVKFQSNISASDTTDYRVWYGNTGVSAPSYSYSWNKTMVLVNYTKWSYGGAGNITYTKSIFVYDVDDDGTLEIISFGRTHFGTGTNNAELRIWNTTFNSSNATDVTLNLEANKTWYTTNHTFGYSVYVYDIDGDETDEIITGGTSYDGTRNRGQICIFNYTSGVINQKNCTEWYTTDTTEVFGVYVYDLDSDGTDEIISIGKSGGNDVVQTRVWNYTNNQINLEASNNWGLVSGQDAEGYVIAVGDADEDGKVELFTAGIAYDGTRYNAFIRVYNYTQGNLAVENTTNWYTTGLTEAFGLAVEDIDYDGSLEVVASGNYYDGTRDIESVWVYNYSANTLFLEDSEHWYIAGHSSATTVLSGDIDNDKIPEITAVGFQNDGTLDRGDIAIFEYNSSFLKEKEIIWNETTAVRDGDFSDAAKIYDLNSDGAKELISGGRYAMTPPTSAFVRIYSVTGVSLILGSEEDNTLPIIDYNPTTTAEGNYSQTWIFINVSSTEENLDTMGYELNNINYTTWDDNDSINYWVNKTSLPEDTYIFYAWGNDTAGNLNQTSTRTVILDTTPPYFTELVNQSSYNNESLNYDIDATDDGVGLDSFAIDDTTNFSINPSTGVITNITTLVEYYYVVNVSINDTVGNLNWSLWSLDVTNVPNVAPTIPFVQAINPQDPTIGNTKSIEFNFTATDTNGFDDIDNNTAAAYFQRAGENTRSNTSCTARNASTNSITFTCTIDMWYFDQNGAWTINATIKDNSAEYAENSSTTFAYNLLTAMVMSPNAINWDEINLADTDMGSTDDPITINNSGNAEPLNINVTAYNLRGEITITYFIFANNFTVENESEGCFGTTMQNATSINVTSAILQRGNNSLDYNNATSGQEQIYFCLKGVPQDISSQSYSSSAYGAWEIRILLVAVIPAGRRKKRLKKNNKILKLLIRLTDELRIEYSGEKETLIKQLTKAVQEEYGIKRKEILSLIRKEIEIPITIFSKELGALEALVKYMKENLNMNYKEIANELGRDERTIWTAYHKAIEKQPEPIRIKKFKITIPLSALKRDKLTILESIIIYLKEKEMKFSEIAELLERDQRNIWTIYSRTTKK